MIPGVNRNNVAYLIHHLVRGMENQCVSFKIGTKLLHMDRSFLQLKKARHCEVMSVLLFVRL